MNEEFNGRGRLGLRARSPRKSPDAGQFLLISSSLSLNGATLRFCLHPPARASKQVPVFPNPRLG
jgi:hypothetical protein